MIPVTPNAADAYRYKYNGKEFQDELGLNVYVPIVIGNGARIYTPDAPRFWQMDPLAEVMPGWSPYNYTFNNPLNYSDPDGRLPIPLITGLVGAAGGALYGVVTGKSGKEIAALAGGGFVAGATLGLGSVAVGAVGGTALLGTTGTTYVMGASGIVGGALGNITEQSIRNIGTSNSLNGNEVVISAAFGIPDAILGGLTKDAAQGVENSLTKYFRSNLSENLSESSLKSFKKEIAGKLKEQGLGRREANKAANQAIEKYKAGLQEGFEATNMGVKVTGKVVEVSLSTLQIGTLQEVKE